jgi:hypothetical protein
VAESSELKEPDGTSLQSKVAGNRVKREAQTKGVMKGRLML